MQQGVGIASQVQTRELLFSWTGHFSKEMEVWNPQDMVSVLFQVYHPLSDSYGWMREADLPLWNHLPFYHGESLVAPDHNI